MQRAYAAGEKAAVVRAYGEEVSYLFRPYTVKSRQMLKEKLAVHLARSCTAAERAEFRTIMGKYRLDQLYLPPVAAL